MIKSSSLSLKNYLSMLILRKSKNIDNNSMLSRVSETVSRLKELTSKNDEFILSTPSENAFTYSKSGKVLMIKRDYKLDKCQYINC